MDLLLLATVVLQHRQIGGARPSWRFQPQACMIDVSSRRAAHVLGGADADK